MLVIHPDECIDCGVCEPECPIEAIIPDTAPESETIRDQRHRQDVNPPEQVRGRAQERPEERVDDREQEQSGTDRREPQCSPLVGPQPRGGSAGNDLSPGLGFGGFGLGLRAVRPRAVLLHL